MTLIIYKNGILAADSRGTSTLTKSNNVHTCGHCGEAARLVDDSANKLTLIKPEEDIMFRGDKLRGIGRSGFRPLSERLIKIIMSKKDVEAVYNDYLLVVGKDNVTDNNAGLLLVGEESNYLVSANAKGELSVEVCEHSKFLAIGSGVEVAEWLNLLMPTTDPAVIINMVMLKEKYVGGDIKVLDFNKENPTLMVLDKQDPKVLVDYHKNIFDIGEKAFDAAEAAKTQTTT
jgi:hypothetical protein